MDLVVQLLKLAASAVGLTAAVIRAVSAARGSRPETNTRGFWAIQVHYESPANCRNDSEAKLAAKTPAADALHRITFGRLSASASFP